MMTFLIFVTLFTHLVLPFIFLRWVALNKGKNKLYRLSVAILVGSFFILMWEAGAGWHLFGNWWPILFLFLFVPAVVMLIKNLNKVAWLPEKKFMPWFGIITVVVLSITFLVGLPEIFSSRNYDGQPLKLMFPMRV